MVDPSSISYTSNESAAAANEPNLEVPLFGPNFEAGALTPEALFAYVSTRLQTLDARVEEVFERQQKADKVRSVLRQISGELAKLEENPKDPAAQNLIPPEGVKEALTRQLDALAHIDQEVYQRVVADLNGIRQQLEGKYSGHAATSAKEQLGNLLKDLDASAQLDMIELQSLTSQRQTAVGLATNLLSSLSETLRSVVANIK